MKWWQHSATPVRPTPATRETPLRLLDVPVQPNEFVPLPFWFCTACRRAHRRPIFCACLHGDGHGRLLYCTAESLTEAAPHLRGYATP